ncbi:ArsR/SmtB family transcription factor [Liquorilactobacillus hordei]|uniref:Transcriptional regulator, ArsR family n=1 Tax=Liquorilactobacillus hordei DSM 19519 TaxID=1423759 RepID=A0A0R1MQ63_9LACO|nr:metalloregulator ArsR/SmtB family transcription factor [Liquorilactobacillus hordei]KRL06675.1 transcriptional regulator, ArsR family [Liquorilactobacillus hordei DSM 19519]QYH52411.1 winged helix-turn-helix transcriptional regulator [Liquorilactobacillus hordei DSM 19519]
MIIELNQKQMDEMRIKIFKALADPTRIEILRYLKKVNREITCGEIGKVVKMSKSAGSYHFKLLREAGLINSRKESREKYVSLNENTFVKYINNFLESL